MSQSVEKILLDPPAAADASELFEASPVATLVFGANGAVQLANAAAHRLMGDAATTLLGRSAAQLLPELWSGATRWSVDVGDSDPARRLQARRLDGSTFPANVRLVCLRGDAPRFLLTAQMWDDLRDACRRVAQDSSVRAVTFRGVGGKAFISGTDISGFAGFSSGRNGIAYERHIDECMAAVDAVPVTTIAIIEGWAVGGGLNIFCASDVRIATPDARFGSPLGRTIGNCLSMSSCARIAGAIGVTMAKRMLLLGEMVSAQEMLTRGVVHSIVEPAALEAAADALCQRAIANAPLTTRASKEMIRRLSYANLPNVDDLIDSVYGSEDFKRGVEHFLAKNKTVPQWRGE